jgi:tetratricopeptide (TPR) repeat protein
MRGRAVFGNLVPFDKIWRTGANANSIISFSDAVTIGDKVLPTGQYAIYSKPGNKEWEVYFYSETDNSGLPSSWEESKIAVAVKVPVISVETAIETFTISLNNLTNNDAHLVISWENTAVAIPIGVPSREKAMASIAEIMSGDTITGNDYFAAASYYHDENIDLDQAKIWIDKAIALNPEPYWILRRKALIYEAIGDRPGAIVAAKLSMLAAEKAGNADYVKLNQDSLKEWGGQ